MWSHSAVDYGAGEVTPEGRAKLTADLSMTMGEAGVRSEVLRPGAGGSAQGRRTLRADMVQGLRRMQHPCL